MSLSAGELAICNLALIRLGGTRVIAADGEASTEYRVANALYPTARDFVLAAAPWEFATLRASLSGQTTGPSNWAYQYDLPANALNVLRVLPAVGASPRKDEPIPFQVFGTGTAVKIATNEASATAEYVKQVTDTTLFDLYPAFKNALVCYLASEMAVGLRATPEVAKQNFDAYMSLLQQEMQRPRQGHPEAKVSLNDGTAALDAVQISNLALAKAGHLVFIQDFTAHTDEARLCALIYGRVRDQTLRSHDWEFATKRASLAGQAASSLPLWTYSYTYPSDCLKARRLAPAAASPRKDEKLPFAINNSGGSRTILANEASAVIEYTAQITDPALFSPNFVQLLVLNMASELAEAFGKPEIGKVLKEQSILELQMAQKQEEGWAETTVTLTDGTSATHVAICNQALARLGHKTMITSLTEATDEARLCALFFEEAVAVLLRDFPWPFARKRATLSLVTASAVTNWTYAYAVPTDMAAALELVNPLGRVVRSDQRSPFELGFDDTNDLVRLYTDLEDAELLYTSTNINTNLFDAQFRDALAWRMAAEIATALGKPEKMPNMLQMYRLRISEAEAASFRESEDGPEPDGEILSARV
jgi:hypothetical protein